MSKTSTLVIGAGASGLVAAISAKRKGKSVIICERLPKAGKKLLVSGNGRCNLLNDDLSENHYSRHAAKLIRSVYSRFGKKQIFDFFTQLGLQMYSKEGRVFPITNQAASVLKVLEAELARLSIPCEMGFAAAEISGSKGGFTVKSNTGKAIEADDVVIAGGGKCYPALGSDGSSYKLAQQMGHKITEPVPSAVPLVVKDRFCHILQGQRIFADARPVIGGRPLTAVSGDLLFTQYGLSGTCILDISDEISVAFNRKGDKDIFVSVDMVPFMSLEELKQELSKRRNDGAKAEDLLTGILPNKFGLVYKDVPPRYDAAKIAADLKDKRFKVAGTRGWNEAEFTNGGIRPDDVREHTLESKLAKGIYFSGEALDVGGERGGYRLAWAWASGFIAGMTE